MSGCCINIFWLRFITCNHHSSPILHWRNGMALNWVKATRHLALFPGLPRLCSQYTAGEEWGSPGSIHHVNDVRWMRGGLDVGGRGPTDKTMHWIIRSSALLQFRTPDGSVIETTRLDRKKLTFKFSIHIFEYWPLPPMSTHVMNAPRPSHM